jgi:AraC-like DNA-binding protein
MGQRLPPGMTAERFLTTLADPRISVTATLSGHPLGHFTVPKGWDTGHRTLDCYLLYVVRHGRLLLDVDSVEQEVGPGGVVLIPPQVRFRTRLAPNRPRPTILRCRILLGEGLTWTGPHCVSDAHDIEPLVVQLIKEADADRPHADVRIRGLVLAIFADLCRHHDGDRDRRTLSNLQRYDLEEFVAANPKLRATPRQLAARVGLSLDYFTRVFRNTYRLAPRQWMVRERVLRAAEAISQTAESLQEIAEEFGYRDFKLFSRQFTRVIGIPPLRYRRDVRLDGSDREPRR